MLFSIPFASKKAVPTSLTPWIWSTRAEPSRWAGAAGLGLGALSSVRTEAAPGSPAGLLKLYAAWFLG